MPTYVMHIGPPKAGSTYLQSCLDALREPLNDAGVHYQTDWTGHARTMNHEWMLATLRAGPNAALEADFDRLNHTGYRYVILSTEGFFGLPEEQLQYLRAMAAGHPFIIVYYCRRWSERIPSQWQQLIKAGRHMTFPEHFARELRGPERFLDLNPKLVWDRFARVFGQESLRLIPFNTLVERKIDLLDHLFTTLGIDIEARPPAEKIVSNESPKVIDTEILRVLNYLYFQATGKPSPQVRVQFLRRLKGLEEREPLTAIMRNDLGSAVVDDSSSVFRSLHDEMAPYASSVVAVDGDGAFFHPRKRVFEYVQQNYLTHDGAVELLRNIFEQVDPRRAAPRAKVAALAS